MAQSTPTTEKASYNTILSAIAEFLGFGTSQTMNEKLDELGVLEPLDRHILRDLITISGEEAPEAAALLILLLQSKKGGSLCLPVDMESLNSALNRIGAAARGSKLNAWLQKEHPALISPTPSTTTPLVLDRENSLLYFQRFFLAELDLKTILTERLTHTPAYPEKSGIDAIRSALEQVLVDAPQTFNGMPVSLNEEQKLAVLAGLIQPLTLISGRPGTGKTSLVAAMLRTLLRIGKKPESMRLAAPTGRAAQRLSDSILSAINSINDPDKNDQMIPEIESTTVHRLLSYNPKTGGYKYKSDTPLPYELIILDEASMVSADQMAALLSALPAGCRLILIGDRDQLPSVGAGAILSDLLPDKPAFSAGFQKFASDTLDIKPKVSSGGRFLDRALFLNESFRSVQGILNFAGKVNRGDSAAADALPVLAYNEEHPTWPDPNAEKSCYRLEPPAAGGIRPILLDWIQTRMLATGGKRSWTDLLNKIGKSPIEHLENLKEVRTLFELLSGARILTSLRRGPFGCETVNRFLSEKLREKFDPGHSGTLFHGLPIMITRNDMAHGLFNGDIGIILRGKDKQEKLSYRAIFDRPCNPLILPIDELPPWEAAFAITVHKSQGSEYGEVLLVMPDQPGHCLNTREILYTGVTRGKKLAIIAGSTAVINAAAATPNNRQSGLKIWSREPG